MKKRPKVIVVMPAYNAARTVAASHKRLPKEMVDEIILVDDCSSDNTVDVAKKLGITTYRNHINLGYGGNLKICLSRALEHGADIIIEFHPDNQYHPESLPEFLAVAKKGYDLALGSRFIHPKEALDRKMPLVKFIANRSLTFIDQFILGIELSEFHSGFRLYTRELLEQVPYLQNSDDYLFSFEIIVQAVYFKFRIAEVQIACDYHPDMHTANLRRSSVYALGTFKTLGEYVVSKFGKKPIGPFRKVPHLPCPICTQSITRRQYEVYDAVSGESFSIYYCTPCHIGFTHPKPKRMEKYYPANYYSRLKSTLYLQLQIRRPRIIRQLRRRGAVLDIGCGDGAIGRQLIAKGYTYTGIETPFSKQNNKLIKYSGAEHMKERSSSYDIATFWESFEHLSDPIKVLGKAKRALKKGGWVVIECPDFSSWEKIPFGSRWFHLDPPRHLFHFTPEGLSHLLHQSGFEPMMQRKIYAPEYTPVGLAQSILYRIWPKLNVFAQKTKPATIAIGLVVFGFAVVLLPISYLLHLAGGSPIQLAVAQKT